MVCMVLNMLTQYPSLRRCQVRVLWMMNWVRMAILICFRVAPPLVYATHTLTWVVRPMFCTG